MNLDEKYSPAKRCRLSCKNRDSSRLEREDHNYHIGTVKHKQKENDNF